MAEYQPIAIPLTNFTLTIIDLMKEFYNDFPDATPYEMAHYVFEQLHNQIHTDEIGFREFVLSLISKYMDLNQQLGHPNTFSPEEKRWLIGECEYYKVIHEALQHSHYFRNIVTATSPRPSTSSDSTSPLSSAGTQVESEATGSSGEPPQPQHDSGRDIFTYGFKRTIAQCMKEYFVENPESPFIEMIVAIHMRLNPALNFDSFETCVLEMISNYEYIQTAKAKPGNSKAYITWLLSYCPYYNEIHEALQCCLQFREYNDFN